MKARNDITFLTNFWEDAKKIGQKIIKELPEINEVPRSKKNSLQFAQFKDLSYSWSPADVLTDGSSKNLEALAYKINYMILRHRAKDVEVMLRSMLTGKIKVWSLNSDTKGKRLKRREKKQNYEVIQFKYPDNDQYYNEGEQDFCHGHFRHESKGYILTAEELTRVKKYFQL